MWRKLQLVLMIGVLPVAAMVLTGCPGSGLTMTYTVTIENLLTGQPLSPPIVATHPASVVMWRNGQMASAGIEEIAETGSNATETEALEANVLVTDVVAQDAPLMPVGSGGTTSVTFEIEATPLDLLSWASMLGITNDGFAGLDSVGLPTSGTKIVYAVGHDAGTEDNTEMSIDLPGNSLPGDPNGNRGDEVATTPQGVITLHPGIRGDGDIDVEQHGWPEPVARITITAGSVS